MCDVTAIVAAGSLMLVTLNSFASSYVVPVFTHPTMGPWNGGIENHYDHNYQDMAPINSYVNPSGYVAVPNHLIQHSGMIYNPIPYNGMAIPDAGFYYNLNLRADHNPEKVAVTQRDNSAAESGVNGHVFGLNIPAVTGGTAVGVAPVGKASTSKMAMTSAAALLTPTTTAPLEDSTPYPLITGSHFTTGAPDVAAVTAGF